MGSDDQKIKQVPSAWEQNSLVQVTVLDECMCLAQCVISIYILMYFNLYWIKTIRPLCFIQLLLITVLELWNSKPCTVHTQQTLITNIIYMYKYPHTRSPSPTLMRLNVVVCGTELHQIMPCKGDSNLRMAWNNCRWPRGAALQNTAHHSHNPELHLLLLHLSIFLTFTPLLLPPLEPRLLLQHLTFLLLVPHLLHLHLKLWGLVSSPP